MDLNLDMQVISAREVGDGACREDVKTSTLLKYECSDVTFIAPICPILRFTSRNLHACTPPDQSATYLDITGPVLS